ncbi:MAG: DUF5908 family protein [Limnohabitans sp.]|nr:DUF5908 family protein [Limnohabitans sp.]
MAIEIKELHIKINVNDSSTPKPTKSGNKDGNLISECVEQVMKIVERKKER